MTGDFQEEIDEIDEMMRLVDVKEYYKHLGKGVPREHIAVRKLLCIECSKPLAKKEWQLHDSCLSSRIKRFREEKDSGHNATNNSNTETV